MAIETSGGYARPFVTAESDRLTVALLKRPEIDAIERTMPFLAPMDFPGVVYKKPGKEATAHHDRFREILREEGVQVIDAHDALNGAIEESRQSGTFDSFLRQRFPALARLSRNQRNQLTARDLYGAGSADTFYPDSPGRQGFKNLPATYLYFHRDSAVMFPEGVGIANFYEDYRKPEAHLTRFMFQNSPQLVRYPMIDFDAEREGKYWQGGDIMVFDQNTLIVGVDCSTQRSVAQTLAKTLDMDVLAVSMPKGPAHPRKPGKITALHVPLIHLDGGFNRLSSDQILAYPYFFQDEYGSKPFNALVDSMLRTKTFSPEQTAAFYRMKDIMREVGLVTVYHRRTGERENTGRRIVSYLEDNYGFDTVFVAGEPEESPRHQIQHLVEGVFHEAAFLGGNVLQLGPAERGAKPRVVMYEEGTEITRSELAKHGVEVIVFDGSRLVSGAGGPHCLAMPIERVAA